MTSCELLQQRKLASLVANKQPALAMYAEQGGMHMHITSLLGHAIVSERKEAVPENPLPRIQT